MVLGVDCDGVWGVMAEEAAAAAAVAALVRARVLMPIQFWKRKLLSEVQSCQRKSWIIETRLLTNSCGYNLAAQFSHHVNTHRPRGRGRVSTGHQRISRYRVHGPTAAVLLNPWGDQAYFDVHGDRSSRRHMHASRMIRPSDSGLAIF